MPLLNVVLNMVRRKVAICEYFTIYRNYQEKIGKRNSLLHFLGCKDGAASATVVCPAEMDKVSG